MRPLSFVVVSLLAAAPAGAIDACATFSGAGGAPDAGPDGQAAGADARGPGDDGGDAASGPPFCTTQDAGDASIAFCDDFDNAGRVALETGCYQALCWTPYGPPGGIVSDDRYSAPNAARVSSGVDAGDGAVLLGRSAETATVAFPANRRKVSASIMIRPVGPSQPGDRAFEVHYGPCTLDLDTVNGLSFHSCPGQGSIPGVPALQPNTWTHVTVSIARTSAGETARLILGDGPGAIDVSADITSDAGAQTVVQAILGDEDGSNTQLIDYDNVLVIIE